MILVIVLIIILLLILASCLKIVPQAHAYVIERLGAYQGTWSVGFHIKMPIIDKVAKKVILKEQVVDFAPQPVITKDNVTMRIDTVVFYQITDPKLYCYGVQNPIMAIENLTATTLRNIIGDLELDETLTSREIINAKMRSTLDEATDPWGIKVNRVELKNIIPPSAIQDAIKNLVAGGLGVSIVSEKAVHDYIDAKRLLQFELPGHIAGREFYIIYHKDFILKDYVCEFIKYLEHCYKQ